MEGISPDIVTFIILIVVAFCASILTFFSGFGLGTILMPVFCLFFPVSISIAMTGMVHLANNVFKWFLIGKNAAKEVVIKFGIPSIIGALLGAFLLNYLGDHSLMLRIAGRSIPSIKVVIGTLLILFTVIEFYNPKNEISKSNLLLSLGGILSGFFGGLSGHQGALRSLFLKKLIHDKESFIATGVIIACMVDISRLGVYSKQVLSLQYVPWTLIIITCLSAFCGAILGRYWLGNMNSVTMHKLVAITLIIFGLLLMAGLV